MCVLRMASETSVKETKSLSNPILRRDNEEYKIVKKLPKRFPATMNDIYISNKTDFKAQLSKCQHLLFEVPPKSVNSPNEIMIHAMGPAINRFFYLL